MADDIARIINQYQSEIAAAQEPDGAWRFCFESGPMTDAYMITLLRILGDDDSSLVEKLVRRIMDLQSNKGLWTLYPDEPGGGNLSATIEAYDALLTSGLVSPDSERMVAARTYIQACGGLTSAGMSTHVWLALTGRMPWRRYGLPAQFVLLPRISPLHFFDFVGYARVHIAPVLLSAGRQCQISDIHLPTLEELWTTGRESLRSQSQRLRTHRWQTARSTSRLWHKPWKQTRLRAYRAIENFLMDRMEPNGTLYSYASATFLMALSFLATGYPRNHPVISQLVQGLKTLVYNFGTYAHVQNSPSTVWDTALLTHALETSGLSDTNQTIARAREYLWSHQQTQYGDWHRNNPDTLPGGWGFSDVNTRIPDVDDTTAALHALLPSAKRIAHRSSDWRRGFTWLLAMQNSDGGWPAFERNVNKRILTDIQIDGASGILTDPSSVDVTGRVLRLLGEGVGLSEQHPQVSRAVKWLLRNQRKDGSWRGKWGICFIYGTWAAVCGLLAVGIAPSHSSIQRAMQWLLKTQNPDGGWGESCQSDVANQYVGLGESTMVQTAWAVDALIAANHRPNETIRAGIEYLSRRNQSSSATSYPTGGGLPGGFYIRYHSYPLVWPLFTLSHYQKKYGRDTTASPM